ARSRAPLWSVPGALPGVLDRRRRAPATLRALPRLRIPILDVPARFVALVPDLDTRSTRPAAPRGLRDPAGATVALRDDRLAGEIRPDWLGITRPDRATPRGRPGYRGAGWSDGSGRAGPAGRIRGCGHDPAHRAVPGGGGGADGRAPAPSG